MFITAVWVFFFIKQRYFWKGKGFPDKTSIVNM